MINVFLFLAFSKLDFGSVATEQRSSAVFINPAGLGINQGSEMLYEYASYDSSNKIGISLGNIGLGMSFNKDNHPLFIAGTSIPINNSLYLGYNYNFGAVGNLSSRHEIGGIYRPGKFLSLGLTTTIEDKPELQGGIAIRPLTDRFTISCDGMKNTNLAGSPDLLYGITFEPTDGISFLGKYDGKKSWQAGVDISFGKFKVRGLSSNKKNDKSADIILSGEAYPTGFSNLGKKNKIAELNIEGSYPEMKTSTQFFVMSKQEPAFYNLLNTIDTLGKRKDVAGLLINFESPSIGIAQYEEIRKELLKFKARGKKIITFSEEYGFGSYYLASVADYIILTPLGGVTIPGLGIGTPHVKGTMDKLGIGMDIEKVGKYKSFSELFDSSSSAADKEQLNAFLDDLWEPMLTEISAGRNIEVSKLEELINDKIFLNSDDALSSKLIDTLSYWDEVDSVLKKPMGKSLKRVNADEMLSQQNISRSWNPSEDAKVAVIIAEGDIMGGESGSNWLMGKYMGSETMRKVIEKVKKDKSIKAVVFRVNSGGGDALASEIILHSIKRLAEKKPVIISMSNVAGSGGYEISCFGNKVMADRATLTGSIGVIGMLPVFKGLYEKLGISWDEVSRGKHADMGKGFEHLTPEERARFKEDIEWSYDKFITEVAENRKLTKAKVDSVGQGRVWSGKSAKDIGLVDEVGGLSEAIEAAKKEAKLKNAEIAIYPEPKQSFSLSF